MNSGPILALTVDDHALLRKGIVGLVNAESDMKVVAEASTGLEATKQFKQHRPDITLMDLQLPGMSGIEAMIAIRQEFPEARIIVPGAAVTGGVRAGDSPGRKGAKKMRLPYYSRPGDKMEIPSKMWRLAYEGLDKCSHLAAGRS